jgi:hypothetical protein
VLQYKPLGFVGNIDELTGRNFCATGTSYNNSYNNYRKEIRMHAVSILFKLNSFEVPLYKFFLAEIGNSYIDLVPNSYIPIPQIPIYKLCPLFKGQIHGCVRLRSQLRVQLQERLPSLPLQSLQMEKRLI